MDVISIIFECWSLEETHENKKSMFFGANSITEIAQKHLSPGEATLGINAMVPEQTALLFEICI